MVLPVYSPRDTPAAGTSLSKITTDDFVAHEEIDGRLTSHFRAEGGGEEWISTPNAVKTTEVWIDETGIV